MMESFCVSMLFFIGSFSMTFAVQLHCYNSSDITKYETATLENPEVFINSTCLNITRSTYFYIFGFRGKVNGTATEDALHTILEQGLQNLILVNWEDEASSGSSELEISFNYAFKVIPNAISIGMRLGLAIIRLVQFGLDLLKVHLVGHSLGAHVMGYAGRTVKAKGTPVQHITGLDAARPLYDNPLSPLMPLDSTCGYFVDCIHTDPGYYGLNQTCGTVDVWVNYGSFLNGTDRQPGCPAGDFVQFSTDDLCSHDRSWKVYNLAILNNLSYIASKADNYSDWTSQNGESDDTIYLGDDVNYAATGNYYMSTSGVAPYGKGEDGLTP